MGLYTILSPASTKHHGGFVRTRLLLRTRQFEVIIPLPHRLLIGRVYFKTTAVCGHTPMIVLWVEELKIH